MTRGDLPRVTARPGWTELNVTNERPAGWYRDPDNPRAHRYWNGLTWTVSLGLQVERPPGSSEAFGVHGQVETE